jgi:hypothetical protein
VVFSKTRGVGSVSGRSDCPPTSFSSVGVNCIIRDSSFHNEWEILLPKLLQLERPIEMSLESLLDREVTDKNNNLFGAKLHQVLKKAFLALQDNFLITSNPERKLIGPVIEGIGWYPELTMQLKHPKIPCWVAGDATGMFRGIVAAFVSGYYAGCLIKKEIERIS